MTSVEECKLNLKERITRDPKILLLFIQHEVARGASVFDAHASFIRTFGNDIIKYGDFDYWFYRFANGMFDLDHVRSSDRLKPELADIPPEIVEIIFENLEWKDRCSVRKVSRKFQDVVDNAKQHINDIVLMIDENAARIEVSDHCSKNTVKYNLLNSGGGVRVSIKEGREKTIDESICSTAALNDFMLNWKRPKMEICNIWIDFTSDGIRKNRLDAVMNGDVFKIKHQISVTHLTLVITHHDDILAILPYVKPKVLQQLRIYCENLIKIDELAEMDQWREAKDIAMREVECNGVDNLLNMTEFVVHLPNISINDFDRMRKAFQESLYFRCGGVTIADDECVKRIRAEIGMERPTTKGELHISCEEKTVYFIK